MRDVRSLLSAEATTASILAPSLWALETRSWRRPKQPSGSNRQTEHRVLARPLGGSIAQASDANAARQSSFDGCLDEFGCEERKRDRHIDLSDAAFVPRSDLLDSGDAAVSAAGQARDSVDFGIQSLRSPNPFLAPTRDAHANRHDQVNKPSIAYWRDHSAGASRRRVTPMPRGSRPSMAAFTSSGARNARLLRHRSARHNAHRSQPQPR
jgi:hypothetical protein